MGTQSGMTTALTLTGVTCPGDLDGSDIKPDYVLANIGEILTHDPADRYCRLGRK